MDSPEEKPFPEAGPIHAGSKHPFLSIPSDKSVY